MQETRRNVMLLGYVSLILLVLLTMASLAWMSISATPTVSDLALSVVTDNALEIAPNVEGAPGEWGTILDLSELSELTAPLKPATYLAAEDAFFAPNYGWDGRVDFSAPTRLTDQNGALLSSAIAAEKEEESGYLYICDFWIRTCSTDCIVALTPPTEREDETMGSGTFVVGEPVWNSSTFRHDESGRGAENAIRMAFRVDSIDDAGEKSGTADIYFYEPNSDGETTMGARGGTLTGSRKLIQQSASSWKETNPILKDTVIYTPGKFLTQDLTMFELQSGKGRHVTMYFWLEGQDSACNASISAARLMANIQFTAIVGRNERSLHAE